MTHDAEEKAYKLSGKIEERTTSPQDNDRSRKNATAEEPSRESQHPPTSYCQSLIHVLKGNIGPGLFAMGDAFKNGGYIVAPILIVVISIISVHCQHILISCSEKMRQLLDQPQCADYADTVEQCFENGPIKLRKWSRTMKIIVNIFICVTQLGFCCIYIVFMSTNIKQILDAYNISIDVRLIMILTLIPALLTSLITNLKWLTPVSIIANVCMFLGLSATFYYAFKNGLPSFQGRDPYPDPKSLALFFGTAIFAFEGIALVLPLKNAMRKPSNFEKPLGVLNVGMFFVTLLFFFTGFFGYLKWGNNVGGSLTLNLGNSILAQVTKGVVSTGVLLGYPLQFFIAIQIMWPPVKEKYNCNKKPLLGELFFRTLMVILTVLIAELVPALGLFISLIGALCSTALALVFPPMIELIVKKDDQKGPGGLVLIKNILILFIALLGFSTGSFVSLSEIIKYFF